MEYYPEYVEEFDGYKDQLYDWTDKLSIYLIVLF